MTAPAGVAAAADEGPAAAVRGGAAGAQAAIVVVGGEPAPGRSSTPIVMAAPAMPIVAQRAVSRVPGGTRGG